MAIKMTDVYRLYPDDTQTTVRIKAVQGETNSRTIEFRLYSSNSSVFIPEEATGIFYVLKNDGYVSAQSCTVSGNSNIVTCTLKYQSTTCSGENKCILQILQGKQGEIRYSNMVLDVTAADIDSVIKSESDFSAVTQILQNSKQIQSQFESAAYITEKSWKFAQNTFNEYAENVVPYDKKDVCVTHYKYSSGFVGGIAINDAENIVVSLTGNFGDSSSTMFTYAYGSTDKGFTYTQFANPIYGANSAPAKKTPFVLAVGDHFLWFTPIRASGDNVQNDDYCVSWFADTRHFTNGGLGKASPITLNGADEENAIFVGKATSKKHAFICTINTSAVFMPLHFEINDDATIATVESIQLPSSDMVCHDVAYDVGTGYYYFAGGYADSNENRENTWIIRSQTPFELNKNWQNCATWTDGRRQCMLSYINQNVYCYRGNATGLKCNPNNGTETENTALKAPFGAWKHGNDLGYDMFLCRHEDNTPYLAYVRSGNITQDEPRLSDVFTDYADDFKNKTFRQEDVYMACSGRVVALQYYQTVHIYNLDFIGDTLLKDLRRALKNVNDAKLNAEEAIADATTQINQKVQQAQTSLDEAVSGMQSRADELMPPTNLSMGDDVQAVHDICFGETAYAVSFTAKEQGGEKSRCAINGYDWFNTYLIKGDKIIFSNNRLWGISSSNNTVYYNNEYQYFTLNSETLLPESGRVNALAAIAQGDKGVLIGSNVTNTSSGAKTSYIYTAVPGKEVGGSTPLTFTRKHVITGEHIKDICYTYTTEKVTRYIITTDAGIYESTDDGRTITRLLQFTDSVNDFCSANYKDYFVVLEKPDANGNASHYYFGNEDKFINLTIPDGYNIYDVAGCTNDAYFCAVCGDKPLLRIGRYGFVEAWPMPKGYDWRHIANMYTSSYMALTDTGECCVSNRYGAYWKKRIVPNT